MNIEVKNSIKPIDYTKSMKILEKRVHDVFLGKKNELLWIVEHNPVYTAGSNSKDTDLLDKDLNVIRTNRGGKHTYHGPGQKVVYFVLNLNKRKKDVRKFITTIENSLIKFLNTQNVEAKTFADRVGIWVTEVHNKPLVKEEKIGAIGLRIKKWITCHGLSFNINPDLNYYNSIHACGLKDYKITSLKKLGVKIPVEQFDEGFSKIFIDELEKL